jgi:hypothetical protein
VQNKSFSGVFAHFKHIVDDFSTPYAKKVSDYFPKLILETKKGERNSLMRF